MVRSCLLLVGICLLLLFLKSTCIESRNVVGGSSFNSTRSMVVPIGVVLNMMSPQGSMVSWCIKTAVSDFYAAHPSYKTRLELHTRSAENLLEANLAVLDLLDHDKVIGVLGPEEETEITFVAELAKMVDVPVISLTAKSSIVSHENNGYLVRTSPDDAIQAQALAAICQGFEWYEVVVLYEDTDYGYRFLSRLEKALQEVEVGIEYVLSISSPLDDHNLFKELEKLATKQTRVFLVDVRPSLGYDLFTMARKTGLMSDGYAWIISDRLSISMASMDFVALHLMEGVLGIRPYIYRSNKLENLQKRWKRKMFLDVRPDMLLELNHYGLWAYDSITALAIAVERVVSAKRTSLAVNRDANGTGNRSLRLSELGPALLNELKATRFVGLSGEFKLVDGKLKQSAFEIFNVYGSGERTIGFWSPDKGITRDLNSMDEKSYSVSTKELKSVIWPGDSVTRPKGMAASESELRQLKVGIPLRTGFTEFVTGRYDPGTNQTYASGFAVDIFFSALKVLPFPISYEFQLYNGTNDSVRTIEGMLRDLQKFDMVVGDITILASRAAYVDFSFPYSESGVVLVVKNRKTFNMWIFIKPLRWDLWLAIIVTCLVMGVSLCVLERQVETKSGDQRHMHKERLRVSIGYWYPVAVLAFPESNLISNRWSLLVLVIWLFMAFILMQSYTANLSAILTVDQLRFAFSDNYYVGCQEGSFMKQYITEQLHINPTRVRSYYSAEDYHNAMTIGSKNGGIDAIFDELPYMKLFLNKYDSQYKIVGPTYKTGGLGFVFPLGSPLTAPFSKAILNVTQGPDMFLIERNNFGPGYSTQDPLSSTISQETSSLSFYEFGGLFLIIGIVTVLALVCSVTPFGRIFTKIIRRSLHVVLINCKVSKADATDTTDNGDAVEGGGSEEVHVSMENNVIAPLSSTTEGEGSNALAMEESLQISACEIQETSAIHDLGVRIPSISNTERIS